jgi:septal ring factor EnvC (AmiA/AmiB activator)
MGLREEIKKMKETLEEMRAQIKYIQFDLEATRRERDNFKKKLAEKK